MRSCVRRTPSKAKRSPLFRTASWIRTACCHSAVNPLRSPASRLTCQFWKIRAANYARCNDHQPWIRRTILGAKNTLGYSSTLSSRSRLQLPKPRSPRRQEWDERRGDTDVPWRRSKHGSHYSDRFVRISHRVKQATSKFRRPRVVFRT